MIDPTLQFVFGAAIGTAAAISGLVRATVFALYSATFLMIAFLDGPKEAITTFVSFANEMQKFPALLGGIAIGAVLGVVLVLVWQKAATGRRSR